MPTEDPAPAVSRDDAIAATIAWVEKAVIGLELCPFASAVHLSKRIRFTVTEARTAEDLLEALESELRLLHAADPAEIETTLLIHPSAMADFLDFNDFLDEAEHSVSRLGLTGEIQVASFHPQYQFADVARDDITNYTNRSPYPILHLLREASVERAVEAYDDPSEIYEKNVETLRRLGLEGWERLGIPAPGKGRKTH
jgi:hypothetical protein